MESTFSVSELIERLRQGEKIICLRCGKGHYVTNPEFIKSSHSFWCDKCGDLLHATSEIVVE